MDRRQCTSNSKMGYSSNGPNDAFSANKSGPKLGKPSPYGVFGLTIIERKECKECTESQERIRQPAGATSVTSHDMGAAERGDGGWTPLRR